MVASVWWLAVRKWLSPGMAVPQGNFTQCFPDRLALVLKSPEGRRINYPSATCPSSLVPAQGQDEPRTSRKQWLHPCLSSSDYKRHLSPNRGNCAQIVPNLSGHLRYSIESTDRKGFSLIPQKIFLFRIALNLLFVHYTSCHSPNENTICVGSI